MFISKIMDYQNLSDEQFKRRFGVYKQTYRKMVESVKSVEAESNSAFGWAFDKSSRGSTEREHLIYASE